MNTKETVIPYDQLLQFTIDIFQTIGCPDADAHTAAVALISADLRGIDSHGVARLIGYVRLQEAGRANPRPQLRVIHETPSTAVVDGDSGLGLVVAPFAMQIAIVDIFSAVLSGANYGPWVPPFPAYVPMPTGMPGKGIGHFFGAMRIDAFRPATEFKQDMDKWIRRFRSAKPVPGQQRVLIPGDPEREMEAERRLSGIPLLPAVVNDLKGLAEKLGVASLETRGAFRPKDKH